MSEKNKLIEIELQEGQTNVAVEQTLDIMRAHPSAYDFGVIPVLIDNGDLKPFNEYSLGHWLAGNIQYFAWKGKNNKLCDPPGVILKAILNITRDLKPLACLINAPTITSAGRVIDQPGYDSESCLYLALSQDFNSIPEAPSIVQVKDAVDELMEPFRYFPFSSILDRSVYLSALLSACVRTSLPACPAFAIDAPVQGSGKTLLMTSLSALYLGKKLPVLPNSGAKNDNELRKTLMATLLTGERVMMIDNVVGVFDSPSLAAFLTSENYSDRKLCTSDKLGFPNNLLIIMSGNNLCFAGDMPRRVLKARINTKTDKSYKRSFDFCPMAYVLENRPKLVMAALTIYKGWLASQSYSSGERAEGRMASFETWDDMVRQPIAWLSRLYPGQFEDVMNAVDHAQRDDPEQQILKELMASIYEVFGLKPFKSAQLIMEADKDLPNSIRLKEAINDLNPSDGVNNAKSLGRLLNVRLDRCIGGFSLSHFDKSKNTYSYCIKCHKQ
jgi:hypothetical protein